jgi:hypothetical protein
MDTGAPAYFRRATIVALWILPGLCALYFVWRHCVPVPFWDEWNTPGAQLASWYRGDFSFADLWSQHNESRKLVPRLIYLPLFLVAGWDVRLIIALTLALVCLGSLGLHNLARQTIRGSIPATVAFGLMNLLLFSPRQYENFLFGIQWETFAPGFALVLAIMVNLSSRSLGWKTICNAALATLCTFTFANGMLLWLLAFPLSTNASHDTTARPRSRLFWRSGYILAAAACIGCYFLSYQHPPFSPPHASLAKDAAGLLQFFLTWIGSFFRVTHPAAVGAVALGLFLALTGASFWLTKDGRWQPHYPWWVLGTYTLISGVPTAVARLGFGVTMATDFRYAVFTVMLHIAIIGLAFTVYEKLGDGSLLKRTGKVVGAIVGLLVVAFWVSTLTAERRVLKKFTEYRSHLQLVLRWADAIPDNPELAWLSPYPEMPRIIHTLAEHDALRPRFVSRDLARTIAEIPGPGNAADGILEQAALDGTGRLVVKGWARIPDQNRPADCVVVGWIKEGRWQPHWVVGVSATDAAFSRALLAPNLPSDGLKVLAWGIDLRNKRAFPLAPQ